MSDRGKVLAFVVWFAVTGTAAGQLLYDWMWGPELARIEEMRERSDANREELE